MEVHGQEGLGRYAHCHSVFRINGERQGLAGLGLIGARSHPTTHGAPPAGEFHPSICRLTALRELTVTQSSDCECSFVAHEELTHLSLLSHLELRCCLVTVPAGLGRLPALKLLTLEAVNLRDAGSMLNWQLASECGGLGVGVGRELGVLVCGCRGQRDLSLAAADAI